MPTPESDFVNAVEDLLPELRRDENLFAGPVRAVQTEVPANAVFCLLTGGAGPAPYIGNQADFRRFAIQVRVRHEDLEEGRDLAARLCDAMHRAAVTGYFYCVVRTEPTYLGLDDVNRLFEWSLNVELGWSG